MAEASFGTTTPSTIMPETSESMKHVSQSPEMENRSPLDGAAKVDGEHDCRAVEDTIIELKALLSQVKNQRQCPLSAYDYMRHLSVLRYLEWTINEEKPEQEAARQLAELLWEHKTGLTRDPRNSINHKAHLIRKWANEYRMNGELSENAQGTHQKTTSTLAREDVAIAAQKELRKLEKPNPSTLREVLLKKIFPKLGMGELKVSENTCRVYMEKWGWMLGAHRKWAPKNKSVSAAIPFDSESDDQYAAVSDETSVLASKSPETSSTRTPTWHAPIPSPTTAILSGTSTHPSILTKMPEMYPEPIMDPGSYIPPSMPTMAFVDSTLPTPMASVDRDASSVWTDSFPAYPQSLPNHFAGSMHSTFQPLSSMQSPMRPQPMYAPPVARYTPKSLDNLIPDPPQMMGHRPVFNGEPVTFVAQQPTFEAFAHDTTFGGRPNPSIPHSNPSYTHPPDHRYPPN